MSDPLPSIADLPNLGPKSTQVLQRAGITSLALEDHQRGHRG